MKLLVITRKVEIQDERMGFFVDWLNHLAANIDQLYVISVQSGSRAGLLGNIDVCFCQTQKRTGRIGKYFKLFDRVGMLWRFLGFLRDLLPQVDGVLAHMIPRYANLAGPLVKKHGKKMVLWYTHKSVDRQLRKSQKWVESFATASHLSFRLQTDKPVHVLGHGIDVEKFKPQETKNHRKHESTLTILTVGRISPSKNLELLIEAINSLVTSYPPALPQLQRGEPAASSSDFGGRGQLPVTCSIIGAPALASDKKYLEKLHGLVRKYNLSKSINFLGPKTHQTLVQYYQAADVFVNLSSTGSLDKTVLEAMACGRLVLTSNEAFGEVLGKLGQELLVAPGDAQALATALQKLYNISNADYARLGLKLRQIVEQHHSLDNLSRALLGLF